MMDIIVVALVVLVVLGAGGALTEVGDWYRDLRKPSWNPPNWLFGPAWTLILGLAGWSVVLAWRHAPNPPARTLVIVLFSLNALFHFLWSPLFFKLRRPDWALFEVPFLWLSILAPMIAVAPFSPLSSWLLLPYLLWVAFAAYLNLVIVRLNAPFGRDAETSATSAP